MTPMFSLVTSLRINRSKLRLRTSIAFVFSQHDFKRSFRRSSRDVLYSIWTLLNRASVACFSGKCRLYKRYIRAKNPRLFHNNSAV